jgi:putative ABC transport system permease protein
MMVVMEFMAIIVAFAIIYNTSTVSLSERKREYATLRVMGMQIKEVAQIMNIEHWILCIMGMVLGIPFTRLLKIAVKEMVDVDLFTFPVSTEMTAYIGGAAGCILAVIIANKTSEKYIKKFDMVEVLKERE